MQRKVNTGRLGVIQSLKWGTVNVNPTLRSNPKSVKNENKFSKVTGVPLKIRVNVFMVGIDGITPLRQSLIVVVLPSLIVGSLNFIPRLIQKTERLKRKENTEIFRLRSRIHFYDP